MLEDHVGGYGDEPYKDRSQLRQAVWEISGGVCEHPRQAPLVGVALTVVHQRCGHHGVELAHIYPRGMGHTGYRDTINNTMTACLLHARSTDDLSSEQWQQVPPPHDRLALEQWVAAQRRQQGWAL